MSVNRGDVVLVDYPFTDRRGSKVRPALVVQADIVNRHITDTILAAISRSTTVHRQPSFSSISPRLKAVKRGCAKIQ